MERGMHCFHVAMPAFFNAVGHTLHTGPDTVVLCETPRGVGICTCHGFRFCDPGHHRCADDCPCACHGQEVDGA